MMPHFFKVLTTVVILTSLISVSWIVTRNTPAGAETAATEPTSKEATGTSTTTSEQQPLNASRAAREEKALQDARRQQLTERESQLAAKEQELKKLSAKVEAQIKTLEENKKRMDEALKAQSSAKKKAQDEKAQKMVKLFKAMKGEQAGKLIDSMKEEMALSLMSRLDTKTIAKLTPYINQPRVLKWITDNLQ